MNIPNSLINQLAQQLNLPLKQVTATVMLLETGATVPFIARYRKEMTGSLDEVQIAAIRDGLQQLQKLEERRTFILETIAEQGKLIPGLEAKIKKATTLTELEDLYLPYKPKRRTRATIARERGLEPLAKIISEQRQPHLDQVVERFINPSKDVPDEETALAGARDIIAEWVNENARSRSKLRYQFERKGVLTAKVVKAKKEEGEKFQDYFDWTEPVSRTPSHRFLAIMRGVNEGILRMNIEPEPADAIDSLERIFVNANNECSDQVKLAVKDAYKRLLKPSLETEIRNLYKEKADLAAIDVFTTNLRELLMAAPLGPKRVMALDPGFRTGCKLVCLDAQGQLLHHSTIYPHDRSSYKRFEAIDVVEKLCDEFKIEAIAVGNGTAGRETIDFLKKLNLADGVATIMVNESGASIYSASEIARTEFPDQDITVRGSVSIGRRLMDPLAELVKIDAKSIGVGQYQHDVDQGQLKKSLDDVVVSCVNKVGVEINTASQQLLTYVSGLGPKLAQNVVAYRNENGRFKNKATLKKVAGIGPKAFEQSAGFIRVGDAKNPLDRSAVHPERFALVKQMAKDCNCTIEDFVGDEQLRKTIPLKNYISDKVGLPTLNDIMDELTKPGRDPREAFEEFDFADGINSIEDLEIGMILPAIVTNVTNFGAFVDIGVHQDGLVHISEIANRFISDPKTLLKVQQKVQVKVLTVDAARKRINLSIKQAEG